MRVPCADCRIAITTDDLEIVISAEGFRELALRDKESLAVVAPGLKSVRLRAVLDKAEDAICGLDMVAANDGVDFLVVSAASVDRAGCHGV